jgi:indolepyruvate ferredoxin oxidoreductase beta subunit
MGTANRPITLLVCALGGEGGGVLSEWLFDTALACGHSAQSTSIPGVAQRTGATTYYVEVFPRPDAELGGRRPVFSLNPVPGAIDLLVSSELLETVRQIGLGMATADRTVVVSSDSRALTVAEKMQMSDGRLSVEALLATVQRHCRAAEVFDMAALARATGTAISAVLLGAIAATGLLPFPRLAFEDTIRRSGKGVEASQRGFAAAFDAVTQRRVSTAAAQALASAVLSEVQPVAAPATLPAAAQAIFPAPLHERIGLGHARLVDYQDAAYAQRYVERLQRLLAVERDQGASDFAATHEAARWLALWMAFDDVVRVAALKLRAARTARVRREVAARDDEIVKLYDHFKPGVPEFAGLLPAGLAARLARWDARRRARGQEAWAMPLKVGTHTVLGALALRVVAGLKGWRRRGSRFAVEQALIERWLMAIEQGAREDAVLGFEIAACGRLIKGYGSTNERGKHNLLHVIEHLAPAAPGRGASERAAAIRAAREAALADDAGLALDRTLRAHGAPARPVRAQPVRFYKRRPELPATSR